jgi:uncharacterized protein YqfA (UPF0365 family)
MPNSIIIILIVIGLIIFIAFAFIIGQFFNLWLQALLSNARVGFTDLIGMRFRKVDPKTIVLSRHRPGRPRHPRRRADQRQPQGHRLPQPRQRAATIDAVAKDGIQLKAKARVTVRTNIERWSAAPPRRPSSPASARASSPPSARPRPTRSVLENPDNISKTVLEKGLDAGTAFEILSIDIADIDVGENIGAKLQADQAEADKRRFQAEAEKRRAMAVARSRK